MSLFHVNQKGAANFPNGTIMDLHRPLVIVRCRCTELI